MTVVVVSGNFGHTATSPGTQSLSTRALRERVRRKCDGMAESSTEERDGEFDMALIDQSFILRDDAKIEESQGRVLLLSVAHLQASHIKVQPLERGSDRGPTDGR